MNTQHLHDLNAKADAIARQLVAAALDRLASSDHAAQQPVGAAPGAAVAGPPDRTGKADVASPAQRAAARDGKSTPDLPTRACEMCGNEFPVTGRGGKPRKFCTVQCKGKFHDRRKAAAAPAPTEPEPTVEPALPPAGAPEVAPPAAPFP